MNSHRLVASVVMVLLVAGCGGDKPDTVGELEDRIAELEAEQESQSAGPTEATPTSSATTSTAGTSTTATAQSEAHLVWPPRLIGPSMMYDEQANSLVLFGGANGFDGDCWPRSNNSTWIFDLTERLWYPINPSMRPGSRSLAAFAYDAQSDLGVMIGGDGGDFSPTEVHNTWIYSGDQQDWRLAGRGPIPDELEQSDRVTNWLIGTAVAYDSESDRTVLFGGALDRGGPTDPVSERVVLLNETWVYDADTNAWEESPSDPHPIARVHHGLAYDAESDRVLAWGGLTPHAPLDPNVWDFDYNTNTWTEHISVDGPQPIGYDGPITFDTESDRLVVIRPAADVWAYDLNTNTWTRQPVQLTGPINTALAGIAYAAADTDRVALFGGCVELANSYNEYCPNFDTVCSSDLWFYDLNTNTWEKIGPPDQ